VRRRLFNFAAGVSLLIFVATVVLWVRSRRTVDVVGHETATNAAGRRVGGTITSAFGQAELALWVRHMPSNAGEPGTGWSHCHFAWPAGPAQPASRQAYLASIGATQFMGVVWAHYHMNPSPGPRSTGGRPAATQSVWDLELPYYLILAAAALLPAWRVRRWLRRTPPHCCAACGYNLTGNTSGVCPECGTSIGHVRPSSP